MVGWKIIETNIEKAWETIPSLEEGYPFVAPWAAFVTHIGFYKFLAAG